jgi:hypothetical protein
VGWNEYQAHLVFSLKVILYSVVEDLTSVSCSWRLESCLQFSTWITRKFTRMNSQYSCSKFKRYRGLKCNERIVRVHSWMLDGANGHSATMVGYIQVSSTDLFFWAKFRILATRKMGVSYIGKKMGPCRRYIMRENGAHIAIFRQ